MWFRYEGEIGRIFELVQGEFETFLLCMAPAAANVRSLSRLERLKSDDGPHLGVPADGGVALFSNGPGARYRRAAGGARSDGTAPARAATAMILPR